MTHGLIARAQALCRHRRIRFPSDLLQYAHQWERERFDLEFCWQRVKPLLSSGQPLWRAEIEIRRHHDQLQRARAAKDLKTGEPLVASPSPAADCRFEGHQQAVPPPASPACGTPDDHPEGLSAKRRPASRQPYRKRTGTKASKVRELLKAQVIRRGHIAVNRLQLIAKGSGLLRPDEDIGRSSTFRRAMKELNIESHRIGFGPGAEYVLRLKPPAWTRGLDVHE